MYTQSDTIFSRLQLGALIGVCIRREIGSHDDENCRSNVTFCQMTLVTMGFNTLASIRQKADKQSLLKTADTKNEPFHRALRTKCAIPKRLSRPKHQLIPKSHSSGLHYLAFVF